VQSIQDDHHVLPLFDLVLSTDDLVAVLGGHTKGWSGRLESESLFQRSIKILELLQLFESDGLIAAKPVDFLSDRLAGSWRLEQVVEQE
jgi:hypothetical protein